MKTLGKLVHSFSSRMLPSITLSSSFLSDDVTESLNLRGNGLSGALPKELSKMKGLGKSSEHLLLLGMQSGCTDALFYTSNISSS